MSHDSTVELALKVTMIREKAIRVTEDDKNYYWLPRSQISFDEDVEEGQIAEITMPGWLASERGFAGY
jgi:hypothetical protein